MYREKKPIIEIHPENINHHIDKLPMESQVVVALIAIVLGIYIRKVYTSVRKEIIKAKKEEKYNLLIEIALMRIDDKINLQTIKELQEVYFQGKNPDPRITSAVVDIIVNDLIENIGEFKFSFDELATPLFKECLRVQILRYLNQKAKVLSIKVDILNKLKYT
jgi:hypothetical protein